MFEPQIKKLLEVNLGLKEGEKLLVFTDDKDPELSHLTKEIQNVALSMGIQTERVQFKSTGQHGAEPPEELWRETFGDEAIDTLKEEGLFEKIIRKEGYDYDKLIKILKDRSRGVPNALIALSYYSTTHTTYRKILTDAFRARYASMPLFEPRMLLGPMDVNWEELAKLTRDIADVLTEAEYAELSSPQGTELELSLKGRRAIPDTGLLTEPGSFGNLPAGEAFIAPLEGTAQGKLTITHAPNKRLERELTLRIQNGAVETIEGFDPYREELESTFETYPEARLIAELGVGTNPKAKRPDNVLEAEKILGTVHIALGDNHTFGGSVKVPFHADFVVFEPTLVVGGRGWRKELLTKGNLRKI
ncbi:MAG: aminopeptidase [Aquificae bacterium]|nr:aminopeptidase [Aquificota bacterium]